MTPELWQEIILWIDQRYNSATWTKEQAVAYYTDLREYDAADVWQAIYRLYPNYPDFPPKGAAILATTRWIVRDAASLERQSMPALRGKTVSWTDFSMSKYGEVITLNEAARRAHAEQDSCNSPRCDIHNRKETAR